MDERSPAGPPLTLQYAAPFSPPTAARLGVWREGRTLVFFAGSAIPTHCIRCGEARTRPAPLRLHCLPRVMRWLAPFLFEMLCFAQTVRMEVGLCDRCRARRIAQCRIAAVLLLSGTIALIAAKYLASIDLLGAAGAFLLAAGILFTKSIPLKIRRISDGIVYASGAGAAYLAGLAIGGPPGIGITSADLASRLAHVRDRRRRKKRRNRHRHRRRHAAARLAMNDSSTASAAAAG